MAETYIIKQKNVALTQERLKQYLSYCPESGWFTWIKKLSKNQPINNVAGCETVSGYWCIRFDRKLYRAHRLAWFYVYGEWPELIDHINGVKDDNRIANLRAVGKVENTQNVKNARKNNSLGVMGVCRYLQKFKAQIQIDGKQTHLGVFDTPEEAGEAYLVAKRLHHAGCTL